MQDTPEHAQPGWLYAGLIIAMLVVFVAVMAWWPAAFAVRLFGTSYFTVGALLGVVVIVAPVVFTALHIRAARRRGSSDG